MQIWAWNGGEKPGKPCQDSRFQCQEVSPGPPKTNKSFAHSTATFSCNLIAPLKIPDTILGLLRPVLFCSVQPCGLRSEISVRLTSLS